MKRSEESDLIDSLSRFVQKLNSEKGALVVVEGLRDARALRSSGFSGDLFMLCHRPKGVSLEDQCSKFEKLVFLLDNDAEGRRLVERTKKLLSGKASIDMYYQRALLPAAKGRIRHVEELSQYAERVSLAVARI